MKMLIVFKKSPRLRFIGHLDLMRTMQRTLRRSDLPVRYSQGFNPHMLLNFASPLSVGITGEREIMEVPVEGNITAEEFKKVFSGVLPVDLPCISVRAVEDTHAAPMALCHSAGYRCDLTQPVEGLAEKIAAFTAQEAIPAIRHTKSGDKPCDLKPMISAFTANGDARMNMILDLRENSTCKPDLLLNSFFEYLGQPVPEYHLTRVQLYGLKDSVLTPLEDL